MVGIAFPDGREVIAFYKWLWVYRKEFLICPVLGSIVKGRV